jgi:hypothetical protein
MNSGLYCASRCRLTKAQPVAIEIIHMKVGHPVRLPNGRAVNAGAAPDEIAIQIVNSTDKNIEIGLCRCASRTHRVELAGAVCLSEVKRDAIAAHTTVCRRIRPDEVQFEPKRRHIVIDRGPDIIDKKDWGITGEDGRHIVLRRWHF